jgi:hypothetical protein
MEKGFTEFMVLGNHSFGIVRKDRWDLTPCTQTRKPILHRIGGKRLFAPERCKRLIIHRHDPFLHTFDTILETTVTSERDKGTTFYLPKYSDVRAKGFSRWCWVAIGGSERVLFVDGRRLSPNAMKPLTIKEIARAIRSVPDTRRIERQDERAPPGGSPIERAPSSFIYDGCFLLGGRLVHPRVAEEDF